MRFVIVGLLAAGLNIVACSRVETAAAASENVSGSAFATTGAVSSPGVAGKRDEWRQVTIPAGTQLPIVLDTAVGSQISHVEQPVQAHLARAILINGQPAIPQGSRVTGVVTDATRSGRVKGRAHVALRFDTLVPSGADQRYAIRTTAVGRTAPGTKKKDALEIGGGAAGGALVGGLIGGKKGALIGTGVGAGAGTGVVLSTRGKEVRLGKGSALTLRLTEPVTVRVRANLS
jgi:hypothetical protein